MTLSLITVTYNAAPFLERTILSILDQSTEVEIEYIIIDGGSTDGTPEIIRKYESRLAYWVSEADRGLYDAMNKGFRVATGDYVWFINAGDTIYNRETISRLAPFFGADVIYGETAITDTDGNEVAMRRLKAPKQLNQESFRMGMLVCHQSFLVKRKIAPEYDLQYRYSADFDWCIQCLKKASSTANTGMILSSFMENGMSTEHRKASLRERYQIMCKYYGRASTALLHLWFAVRFYFAKLFKGRV